jgi:predicted aspartyl protease
LAYVVHRMVAKRWIRVFFTAWLVVANAPLRTMAAADDSAAALLAKHAAYVGWKGGDGSIKTLRETGEAARDGKVVRRFSRLQMGQIYRSSVAANAGSFEGGFTGRVFWQSNVNGFTTSTVGDVVKYLATRIQLADEELTALPGMVRGTETIGGVRTTIVRVVAVAGLPVDLSIDPDSGAYKRITIDPDGRYEERFDVLADTDVGNGKRVLSSWRYVGGQTVYTYTKIEANTDISADELHPPKPVATWTFGPPTQTAPIAVFDKYILIDAMVNGHPGHFMFDTGAAGIVFTDSFARTVGATRRGETRIVGIGGGARANIYRIDTLAIGANTLHDVSITSGLDERLDRGVHIDGYIGFDLLAGAIVEMDLDAQTVRILDPKLVAPDTSQGITVHIDLSTGHIRVPMTVGGRTPVIGTIDSGDTFYALFSSQLVSRGHVSFFSPPDSLASKLQFFGVNGQEVDTCGRLESLELGPITYRPVPACMSDSMSYNNVLIGFDFFKAFNYVFDYPDGEILMTARKNHS